MDRSLRSPSLSCHCLLRILTVFSLWADVIVGNTNGTAGRPLPPNLAEFYDNIRAKGSCSRVLATGFWATDTGNNTFSYCGDHLDDYNVLYIQGKRGALADMDIDCDGIQNGPADDGRCSYGLSPDYQNTTAFQDIIAQYGVGISDLNTYVHPYVVLGNDAPREQKRLWTGKMGTVRKEEAKGWKTFNPQSYGVEPLSIVAVVCGGGGPDDSSREGENEPGSKRKLVYGIWGDTNGDDGSHPMVGETSLSLATACEGDSMTGDNGYDGTDVLYLAFLGSDAVPGPDGADWTASDFGAFEKSIETLGDRLVQRVGTAGAGGLWYRGGKSSTLLGVMIAISMSIGWILM
ncbi:fungal chitosanase [Naviculisporaceae sp. PSN 640]